MDLIRIYDRQHLKVVGEQGMKRTFLSPFPRFAAIVASLSIGSVLTMHQSMQSQIQPAISGTIVDIDGQPLDGVKLFLWDSNYGAPRRPTRFDVPLTVTDSTGSFRITRGAGRYLISPIKDGFVYPRRHAAPNEAGVWVEVQNAVPVESVRITMVRQASIIGRVVDRTGNPAVQVPVSVLENTYDDDGRRQMVFVGPETNSVKTDDRGEYRFFGLPPGEYYVRLHADSAVGRFPAVYYPASPDRSGATSIVAKAGDELRLNPMTLVERETATVRLRFPDTAAVRLKSIQFEEGNVFSRFETRRSVPSKEMVVELARGVHEVKVQWGDPGAETPGSSGYSGKLRLDATVDEIVQDIVPIPVARVTTNMSLVPGNSEPISSDVWCILASQDYWVRAACNGETYLPPGSYELKFQSLPADVYVASARSSEHDFLTGKVEIRAETDLKIMLGTPGASVAGNVRSPGGEQIANAAVVLIPDASHGVAFRYRSTTSDMNGRFEVRGIAPGIYHLFAWPDIDGAAYRNADFMKRFEGKGIEIRIEGEERRTVDVKLTGI
jgi:protocatechuate 3,4-dioxygenase beta subunit